MAYTDSTPVQLTVTLTDGDGKTTVVVNAGLFYGYAKDAVLTALDQVYKDVAAKMAVDFEAANAANVQAAQAPIVAAQTAATEAFTALEA